MTNTKQTNKKNNIKNSSSNSIKNAKNKTTSNNTKKKTVNNTNNKVKKTDNKKIVSNGNKRTISESKKTDIKKLTTKEIEATNVTVSKKKKTNGVNNTKKRNSNNSVKKAPTETKKTDTKDTNKRVTKKAKRELLKVKVVNKVLEEKETIVKEKDPKKISVMYFYLFLIIYLELITKFIAFKTTDGIILTFIFSLPIIIVLYLLTNIFKKRGNIIICFIVTTLLSFYYGFMGIFYKMFSNVFSFNTIGLASDIGEFKNMIFDVILKNIPLIILYLIPLILLIIFKNKFNFKRTKSTNILYIASLFFVFWGISLFSLLPNKNEVYSAYNLYYNINSEIKSASKFGIATYTRIDIKRIILGFDEKINIPSNTSPKEAIPEITYNKLNIQNIYHKNHHLFIRYIETCIWLI